MSESQGSADVWSASWPLLTRDGSKGIASTATNQHRCPFGQNAELHTEIGQGDIFCCNHLRPKQSPKQTEFFDGRLTCQHRTSKLIALPSFIMWWVCEIQIHHSMQHIVRKHQSWIQAKEQAWLGNNFGRITQHICRWNRRECSPADPSNFEPRLALEWFHWPCQAAVVVAEPQSIRKGQIDWVDLEDLKSFHLPKIPLSKLCERVIQPKNDKSPCLQSVGKNARDQRICYPSMTAPLSASCSQTKTFKETRSRPVCW